MELILFRHGIAVDRGTRLTDGERELTEKGIKKVKEAAKTMARILSEKKSTVIWSSPLVRAEQTAQLIREALELEQPSLFEFIASGDFEKLEEQLCNMPEDACIIITGHAPDLDEWVTKLSGSTIKLQKGGAAGLEINRRTPLEARLIWMMQPGGWKRFG